MRDEELAPAGVLPVERHSHRAAEVWQLVQLVANRVAGPAFPVATRIAVLDDEVGNHAVNRDAVEEPLARELDEVGDGERRVRDGQLDLDGAAIELDERVRR